jgi:hypothetical protein
MTDEQLESRILEVVNAELGYQNDRGVKALAGKVVDVDKKKLDAFIAAKDTDTKAEILSKVQVAEDIKPIAEEVIK